MNIHRVNACDVDVDGHVYCTGQYENQQHAVSSLSAEADRLSRLAGFIKLESWDTDEAGAA